MQETTWSVQDEYNAELPGRAIELDEHLARGEAYL